MRNIQKITILTLTLIVSTTVVSGCGKTQKQPEVITVPNPEQKMVNTEMATTTTEIATSTKTCEDIIKEIPKDYKILSYCSDQTIPKYLSLKKDSNLYLYNINNQEIKKIDDLVINENEQIFISPSITDNNQFFIKIEETKEAPSLLGYVVIKTRQYFYDLNKNLVQSADFVNLPSVGNFYGCYEYDSKYSRFFSWYCGEGCGNSIPLFVYNINNKENYEIINKSNFKIKDTENCLFKVVYYNNYFLIYPKNKDSNKEIILLNPNEKLEKKYFYLLDSESQLTDKEKEIVNSYNFNN